MNDMENQNARDLLAFIRKSPTAFHAVDTLCRELTGFTQLHEGEKWQLTLGGRYYVTRNGSSIIAFTLPEQPLLNYLLTQFRKIFYLYVF